MADETRIVLEFIGDPSGLKPAVDAIKAIGGLTEEQIKDFQKANEEFAKRSKSLDKQVKETEQLNKSTEKVEKSVVDLNKQTKKIPDNLAKAKGKMDDLEKKSSSLLSSFKKLAATLGIAFGVQQAIRLGREMIDLAAKGEGVRTAFAKLNNPNLLADLRSATRGTVTDVELMQSALRAKNFQVPLEKLASFFEFATKRSIETGESVDYLVNSIVDGIGRKSTLVLDNLGISATELQAEIKKTGDFGLAAANIIERGLKETGEVADTTAVKIARLSTAWENFKEAAGKDLVNQLNDLNVEIAKTSEALGTEEIDAQTIALKLFHNAVHGLTEPIRFLNWVIQKNAEAFAWFKDFIGIEPEVKETSKQLTALQKGFAAIREEINKNKKDPSEDIKKEVKNINLLEEQIKTLRDSFKEAEVGSQAFYNIAEQIRAKSKELADALSVLDDKIKELDENPGLTLMDTKQITELKAFSLSLADLNDELSKAKEKRLNATEFSKDFNDAEAEIARLEDRIKNFGDTVIKVNAEVVDSSAIASKQTVANWDLSFQQIGDGFQSLFSSIMKIQSDATRYEMSMLDELLASSAISREEYEQRRKELARQQAQDAKDAALFNAIVNVARSVTSALAAYDYASAVLFGIIGAAEIAAIAAEPIPQFAKGTKKAPPGFKWVGEEGPELMYDDGGYPIITNRESQIISNDPYSPQAAALRKKYDIPNLNVGLFKQPLRLTDEAYGTAVVNSRKNDLAQQIAHNIMFPESAMIGQLKDNQRTDRHGFRMMVKAIREKRNERAGW